MRIFFITAVSIFFIFSLCDANEKLVLKDNKDKISYSLGFQIGSDFKKENKNIEPEAFLEGVKDSLAQKEPVINPDEMQSILLNTKKRIVARQRAEKLEMREQRLGGGKIFFAENAKKDGVITLPSGLQYKVIRNGNGKQPGPEDQVTVHYKGTLIDGTEFGSTYNKKEPQNFNVNGVIPGLTEGLQLMQEGAKYEFFVPADLAYGRSGLLDNRVVIFELELFAIKTSEENK